jgi:Zn-dependent protease with chaperone function
MIGFKATYFDGKTSRPQPVVILFDGFSLSIAGDEPLTRLVVPMSECEIIPPLGRSLRVIRLPDGGLCETDDFPAVEELERQKGANRGFRLIHLLESNWKSVIGSVICLCLFVWAVMMYGVPLLAGRVAASVPPDLMNTMSRETLKVLDGRFLEPSKLPKEKAARVNALFQSITRETGGEGRYQLQLRKSSRFGPNAFALPSGTILVTDELVALSKSDRELGGILVHEMAHVKKRHAMRQILQSTGLIVLISAFMGDITSISSLAATLPVLLVESNYSREFEREADKEAALYLTRKGWGTKPYQEVLGRLAKDRGEYPGLTAFSTHPRTRERIEDLKKLERSMGSNPSQ